MALLTFCPCFSCAASDDPGLVERVPEAGVHRHSGAELGSFTLRGHASELPQLPTGSSLSGSARCGPGRSTGTLLIKKKKLILQEKGRQPPICEPTCQVVWPQLMWPLSGSSVCDDSGCVRLWPPALCVSKPTRFSVKGVLGWLSLGRGRGGVTGRDRCAFRSCSSERRLKETQGLPPPVPLGQLSLAKSRLLPLRGLPLNGTAGRYSSLYLQACASGPLCQGPSPRRSQLRVGAGPPVFPLTANFVRTVL